jgi:hypothetical protein
MKHYLTICCIAWTCCFGSNDDLQRAAQLLNTIYSHYCVEGSHLLRETYPFDDRYKAGYLASDAPAGTANPYAYLWPFSGTLSAVGALHESTGDGQYEAMLLSVVLPGLEQYFDTVRTPAAYASYIREAPASDRFYDDNIWIGIDFTDRYMATHKPAYLDKARMIWKFIESGTDERLGGGVYWCEQKKRGKNTCSNAPASVYALKLFEATGDSLYLCRGKTLYAWTQRHLQDTTDCLYYDNLSLSGRVDRRKYAYNSGQMLQAAALLHRLTGDEKYLADARCLAEACMNRFSRDFRTADGRNIRLLTKGNVWFTAIMFRGFVELYRTNRDDRYIRIFRENLNHAWTYMRDADGLFNTDWSGQTRDNSKWLLTQTAMVEMYARIAAVER